MSDYKPDPYDKMMYEKDQRIRELEAALRISTEQATGFLAQIRSMQDHYMGKVSGSAPETACECMPLDVRGTPGDLEIYCPKCGKVFRKSETKAKPSCTYCVDGRCVCGSESTGSVPNRTGDAK